MIHALKGSPRIHTPISKVDMGPIMPVCEVNAGPMRSIAIMTSNTGSTVQAVALSSDSHSTGSGTHAEDRGRSKANCSRQKPQAADVASPARRKEPSRWTSWPL